MSENEPKDLTRVSSSVPTHINLGPTNNIDLSWLSEEDRKALLLDFTKGMLDIQTKAQELNVDANILKKSLTDFVETTRDVSEHGDAVTITHTQDSKLGRTEIMMGNTDHAKGGKLTKSQTGTTNWTPYYIFAAIVAIILIFALSK